MDGELAEILELLSLGEWPVVQISQLRDCN